MTAPSTRLSGTTTISYSLIHNSQGFATETDAQLIQGTGILTAVPGFVDFPNNFHLHPDAAAVNAADPQADYSREPEYNGQRADLGAYGNTRESPQQPPLDQMAVSLQTNTSSRSGQPGQVLSYTLTVKNTGSVTDSYALTIKGSHDGFRTSLFPEGYRGARQFTLSPQEEIDVTVWDEILINSGQSISNTFSVLVGGFYGVQDELELTTQVSLFQENAGQLVMEAEHFHDQTNQGDQAWLLKTNLPDYVGAAYLASMPDVDLQYFNPCQFWVKR